MLLNIIFIYLIVKIDKLNSSELARNPSHPYIHCWDHSEQKSFCQMDELMTNSKSSCMLELRENKIVNKKCGICHWRRTNYSPICDKESELNRQCCCNWPGCNRQVYLDAHPGWITDNLLLNDKSCHSIRYNALNIKLNGGWEIPKAENCKKDKKTTLPMCKLEYVHNSTNGIISVEMGCVSKEEKCYNNGFLCQNSAEINGNKRIKCCCQGQKCAQRIYRRFVFDEIMKIRLETERKHKKFLEDGKEKFPKKLFINNEIHQNRKTILIWAWVGSIAAFSIFIFGMFSYCKVRNVEHKSFSSLEEYEIMEQD